jgi:hypothetical protein
MPSDRRSRARIARIAASAARSAWVTGELSAFVSISKRARNQGRIAAPAASASLCASATSSSVTPRPI